jgi:hypothetical protein
VETPKSVRWSFKTGYFHGGPAVRENGVSPFRKDLWTISTAVSMQMLGR